MILATKEAAKNHKKTKIITNYLKDIDSRTDKLREQILNGTWNPPDHEEVWICEGANQKPRNIVKPRWDNEQIVHHMLMRQFETIVEKRLYRYSAGSVKGKGLHFICKSMRRWVKKYGDQKFYVAELDIKKFYDNVDIPTLKSMLEKKIRDKRYLDLLFKVIGDGDKGIPKGFYVSPLLSHFYLLPLDSFITQKLKPQHYARYVDNMWLFSTNKRKLHKMVEEISEFLGKELKLKLKENWQVFRFDDGHGHGRFINCLGYNICRNKVRIRKSILKRIRAKAMRMRHHYTYHNCCSMISRMGWFTLSDSYGYYLKWIKPYFNIRYAKKRIRRMQQKNGNSNSNKQGRSEENHSEALRCG